MHRGHDSLRRIPSLCPPGCDHVQLSPRRSIISFGMMRPKLIAKMTLIAVTPLAIVSSRIDELVFELLANWTSPLAILNRKTPGINDTTEAKPMAANGIR